MNVRNDGFVGTTQELEAVEAAVLAALAKVDAVDGSAPEAGSKVRAANVISEVRVAGTTAEPAVNLVYSASARFAGSEATAPLVPHAAFVVAALLSETATASAVASVNGIPVSSDDLGVADYDALGTALGF